jgi:multidrug efflux pump subunit AcrA (membrane-fusion protein)
VVVNSPANGEVRRLMVSEGSRVDKEAPMVEIATQGVAQEVAQPQTRDAVNQARDNVQSAEKAVDAARAQVVTTEAEVQRLRPMVAAGQTTQAELDGAQANYDRAQQRLQQAQANLQKAEAGVVAARQPGSQPAPQTPHEQLVIARAPSSGEVRVISVRPGEHVTLGQPLATISSPSP